MPGQLVEAGRRGDPDKPAFGVGWSALRVVSLAWHSGRRFHRPVKRVLRVVGAGLIALLAGGALLMVAGLGPVDVAPAEGRDYARRTLSRWQESRALPRASGVEEVAPLRAGFGRAQLTPTLGAPADRPEAGEFLAIPLAGYGDRRGRPATGVHEDVWVKAVALSVGGRTGVVVAADALIIPREVSEIVRERLAREFGLGAGQVYFGATHTHCSLGGWGEGWVGEAFAGAFNPGVRLWMARQMHEAVARALADSRPAEVGWGSFEAGDLTRNRLVGDRGRIDPEFSLLALRQDDGDQAVIGSFSAHATVLSGRCMEFSGDYPGQWQRAVEERRGGLAVFLAGGVGSHSPKPPAGGFEGARRMGEMLAERTAVAMAGMVWTNRVSFDQRIMEVVLPELQPRLADAVRLRPWVARRLLPVRDDTWLQAWRVGGTVWLSTPCDYSGEMALDLKAWAGERGLKAVVTSFNGDYVGYVVPSKYYALDTYETRTMAFFGPQLPDYFDVLLKRLIDAVASGG